MKRLKFNATDRWTVSYHEGYEDYTDETGDYVDSVYTETIDASSDDAQLRIHGTILHDYPEVSLCDDILLPEVLKYLGEMNIPEHLAPNPEDLILECEIAGCEALYYLNQKPEEEGTNLRMAFFTPDGGMAFIDFDIPDWRDADNMVDFLDKHLSFVDGK